MFAVGCAYVIGNEYPACAALLGKFDHFAVLLGRYAVRHVPDAGGVGGVLLECGRGSLIFTDVFGCRRFAGYENIGIGRYGIGNVFARIGDNRHPLAVGVFDIVVDFGQICGGLGIVRLEFVKEEAVDFVFFVEIDIAVDEFLNVVGIVGLIAGGNIGDVFKARVGIGLQQLRVVCFCYSTRAAVRIDQHIRNRAAAYFVDGIPVFGTAAAVFRIGIGYGEQGLLGTCGFGRTCRCRVADFHAERFAVVLPAVFVGTDFERGTGFAGGNHHAFDVQARIAFGEAVARHFDFHGNGCVGGAAERHGIDGAFAFFHLCRAAQVDGQCCRGLRGGGCLIVRH